MYIDNKKSNFYNMLKIKECDDMLMINVLSLIYVVFVSQQQYCYFYFSVKILIRDDMFSF